MTECSSQKWAQWTQLCSCRRLVQQETQLAKHKALLLHISTEQDIWEEHVLRGAYFHKLLEKMKSETVQSVQAETGGHGEVHHPQMPESLTW